MDGAVLGFLLIIAVLAVYFVPTIVAFVRDHHYRWVIFALNLFGGVTGVLWIAALIWAVFPHNRTFVDPVIGSATGHGQRNAGDAVGAALFGAERGYAKERGNARRDPTFDVPPLLQGDASSKIDLLERLQRLRESGVLSDEEFEAQKVRLLGSWRSISAPGRR